MQEDLKLDDLTHICRTCLQKDDHLVAIFYSEVANMLNYCGFWQASENYDFPSHICVTCQDLLGQSYRFKLQCDKSYLALKKLLSREKEELYLNIQEHSVDPLDSSEWKDESKPAAKVSNSRKKRNKQSSCSSRQHTKSLAVTEYKCKKCLHLFQTEKELNDHVTREHAPSEIIKPAVEEKNNEDFVAFLDEPLPPPLTYQCGDCLDSFQEESDLRIHKSVHTGDGLKCVNCQKLFHNRQMLKRHIKIHMVNKPHVCQSCGKGFAESYALAKHMLRHSGVPKEKRHFCSDCGQGFSEPFYLNVHRRKHTGERPLQCSYCDKAFADPRSFKVHIMTHTGEKPYKCHFCPKAFSQSVNLTKHIRIHTGERPYVCQECGKSFTQSSSLDKHLRMHSGEKPYACETCCKRFSEKGTLVKHVRTHTGEKPYMCGECGRAFGSSSELGLHTRKHTGVKKHVCDVCGKDFPSPSNLLIHTRTHTGEKPFMCSICWRRFVDKSAMKKHLKVHEKKTSNDSSYGQVATFEDPKKSDTEQIEGTGYSEVEVKEGFL